MEKNWVLYCVPVIPAPKGSISGRVMVQACPSQKERSYLKNNQNEKGWKHGPTGRALAQQAQGPKFKHQY
jgi:hypothetical protein